MNNPVVKVVGYYNPQSYPISISLSNPDIKLSLAPGKYVARRVETEVDGEAKSVTVKVNDPRLANFVRAGGLAVAISKTPVPVVLLVDAPLAPVGQPAPVAAFERSPVTKMTRDEAFKARLQLKLLEDKPEPDPAEDPDDDDGKPAPTFNQRLAAAKERTRLRAARQPQSEDDEATAIAELTDPANMEDVLAPGEVGTYTAPTDLTSVISAAAKSTAPVASKPVVESQPVPTPTAPVEPAVAVTAQEAKRQRKANAQVEQTLPAPNL